MFQVRTFVPGFGLLLDQEIHSIITVMMATTHRCSSIRFASDSDSRLFAKGLQAKHKACLDNG